MKTAKDIYIKIIDKNNIYKAILNASKGKKERENVMRVIDNITLYVDDIYNKLSTKTYIPKPYVEMKIHDGVRKKERIIYKPSFYPDQIIHWSLMQQIEPLIMKGMYEYCCGSVKNRGIMHGMKYLKKILVRDRKNTKYCLKLDIKKFYPSINQSILKSNFLRIKRRYKKISKKQKITYTDASASLSYYGWLKHCDSYNFNQKYVKPYVDLNKCKGVIKNESRKQLKSKL